MSTIRVAPLLVTAILCVAPAHAAPQQVAAVGQRVRLLYAVGDERGSVIGTVQSISADSVRVTYGQGVTSHFTRQSIRRIEVSRGTTLEERSDVRGLLWLAGITGTTAGIGAMIWSPCTDTGAWACFWHPESRVQAAQYGALIGLPIGILVARAVARDRQVDVWEEAALPTRDPSVTIRVSPSPGSGAMDIGLVILWGRR